jgi:hypothetical protein
MKKLILFAIVAVLGKPTLYAQNLNDTSAIEKTGWLLYKDDHVIWFESDLRKSVKNKAFFNQSKYPNGLVVDYLSIAKYYKSIAACYSIKDLSQIDTVTKKADYTLPDSICILPVRVKFIRVNRPVSELLKPMGLSFMKDSNEVTIAYNFEADYGVSGLELLRKRDKKKIKKVKDYTVTPDQ